MTEVRLLVVSQGEAGRVATVTVDNPEKHNVLDPPGIAALARTFEQLAADESLRAVVLRGAGNVAFIGGADIRAMSRLDREGARRFITGLHLACDAIRNLPVPVIARIEGYALGAGLEIAASCDLRIAADTARLGMPEVKVGIPSVIEAALLPRLIGWGRARLLLYTGEMIDAATAERWGLVERIVRSAEMDNAVESCVMAIIAAAPAAIRLQKRLMREWETLALNEAITRGIDTFAEAYATREPGERMSEFLQRRSGVPG